MRFSKKLLQILFSLLVSLTILYADLIYSFPSEINMYKNELHNLSLGAGVFIGNIPDGVCVQSTVNGAVPLECGDYHATLKIANTIPFRKIRLRVSDPESVCVSGELVGLRLYNKGLIVTDTAGIKSNGRKLFPARDADLLPGDVILEINGKEVLSGRDASSLLTENTSVTILRGSTLKKLTVHPVRDDEDGVFKLGIWIRDSTAGVGTLTFFDEESGTFGALGHSISDYDTKVVFNVKRGSIEKSSVASVIKGSSGTPGEISGRFSSDNPKIGTVEKNCEAGIFGKIVATSGVRGTSYPIGVMSQVEEGNASILSTVDDSVKEYDIKILRAMPFGAATKGMMIEITDKNLLEKTGGIIQGMSGSPILQNGKIIGAVTHVLVNDPTRGYGIFIENMLTEAEKISD